MPSFKEKLEEMKEKVSKLSDRERVENLFEALYAMPMTEEEIELEVKMHNIDEEKFVTGGIALIRTLRTNIMLRRKIKELEKALEYARPFVSGYSIGHERCLKKIDKVLYNYSG